MGRMKDAFIAECDANSVANALALASAPDPYHYDVAVAALVRIAEQTNDGAAIAIARGALVVIAPPSEPTPPGGGRYATEREYREHLEASTRPARA